MNNAFRNGETFLKTSQDDFFKGPSTSKSICAAERARSQTELETPRTLYPKEIRLDPNGINGAKSVIHVILSEEGTADVVSEIVREAFSPPYEFPPLAPNEIL